MRGSRLAYGSWKTIWSSLRVARSSSWPIVVISLPRKRTDPGGRRESSDVMPRAVVLLPQPDSPTSPSVSPGCSERSTPSTARTTPFGVGKWSLSPSTFSITRGSGRRARGRARTA